MKTIALLSAILLLLASCASSGGLQEPVRECGPGEEIAIQAGGDIPRIASRETSLGDRVTMIIAVSNNSHQDVTVRYIRVQQVGNDTGTYQLDTGYGQFNQTIAEGDEFDFAIPMTGRQTGTAQPMLGSPAEIVLSVDVGLSTGAKYRCRFSVPIPI